MIEITDPEDIAVLDRLELPLLVIALRMSQQLVQDAKSARVHIAGAHAYAALMDRIEALTSPESAGDDDGR